MEKIITIVLLLAAFIGSYAVGRNSASHSKEVIEDYIVDSQRVIDMCDEQYSDFQDTVGETDEYQNYLDSKGKIDKLFNYE